MNITEYKNINFIMFLWLMCCGFYLTKITSFSPIYLSFALLLTFSFYHLITKNFILKTNLGGLLLSIGFSLSLFLIINTQLSNYINILVSIISFNITYHLFYHRKISKKKFTFVFLFYTLLFSVDAFWRLSHPDLEHLQKYKDLGIIFQIYKSNSIMYIDSNFVGLECLFFISMFLYFILLKQENYNFYNFLLLFFMIAALILTFSRASIASCFILLFFIFFRKNKKASLVIFLFTFITLIFFIINKNSVNDISFNSKFKILDLSISHIINSDFVTVLLGVGVGNAEHYISIGTHNLLLTYLLETGLVGFVIFLLFLIFLIKKLKLDFIYTILPFLIASMSLGSTAIPYFFSYTALCILYKENKFKID